MAGAKFDPEKYEHKEDAATFPGVVQNSAKFNIVDNVNSGENEILVEVVAGGGGGTLGSINQRKTPD